MKFFKKNIFQILIIIFISLLTWYKILFRVPTGEGYYYFSKSNNIDFIHLTFQSILRSYDFFPKLIFTILIPIFKDNISCYMYFQFFIMISVYLTFYFVLNKIFKDKVQSLLSTIFFISNYVGQFTMIGQGDYQRFIQRVPNLVPTFISFLFLVLFIRNKNPKYWVYSFAFYLSAMIMSHSTSFFLPLFIILPCMYFITRKLSLKKTFLSVTFFTLATFIITNTDPLSKPANYSILQFIKRTPRLIEMILYQISVSGFPVQFTSFLAKHQIPPIQIPYIPLLFPIFILIGIFLYLGYLKIKRNKNTLVIYLTIILSLFPISFLTMYAYNAIPNPLINFGEDRIYFIHSILFAIIWGMIIKAFLKTKNKIRYIVVVCIVTLFFLLQNILTIYSEMDKIALPSTLAKNFIQTMKPLSPAFNQKTIIIAPSQLLVTKFLYENLYNIPLKNFITLDETTSYNLNNTFIFDFKGDKIIYEK